MPFSDTDTLVSDSLKQDRAVAFAQAALKSLQKDLQNAIEALPADAPWEQGFRYRLMLGRTDQAIADVKAALEQ